MIKSLIRKIYMFLFNMRHNTKIKSLSASIRAVYGKDVLIDYGTVVTSDVRIGDYSYVNKNSSIEHCDIGKYCSISSGVYICPFEHNLSGISTHPFFDLRQNKDICRHRVTIGNDVLISLNVIVLEGVTIGNGAVVAAGAVVTKDVKPYEIVGGVPAKNIGFRFPNDIAQKIEATAWWNKDLNELKPLQHYFNNVEGFLSATKMSE